MRDLCHRIVDTGFRALAKELHPDVSGGSSDAMASLTAARDVLKRMLPEPTRSPTGTPIKQWAGPHIDHWR
jgi:hypothetical protein